jgi:hypothetical protein
LGNGAEIFGHTRHIRSDATEWQSYKIMIEL